MGPRYYSYLKFCVVFHNEYCLCLYMFVIYFHLLYFVPCLSWISYLICHGLVHVQSGIEGERSLDIFCIGRIVYHHCLNFLFLIQIENFSVENVQPSVNEQSLSFKVTTSTPRVHDSEMCWVMGLTSPSTVYLLYHCGLLFIFIYCILSRVCRLMCSDHVMVTSVLYIRYNLVGF
jgi:hypothetical protein